MQIGNHRQKINSSLIFVGNAAFSQGFGKEIQSVLVAAQIARVVFEISVTAFPLAGQREEKVVSADKNRTVGNLTENAVVISDQQLA